MGTTQVKTLDVGGDVQISYVVHDGGTPVVVLLHGLAGSGRELEATARALSDRKVVVVDQRGHGLSSRHPADTSREAFVADVVSVIEAERAGPVDLVGQSMGAHTAMLVAASRPDLVRRLVLLEGNEGGGSPEDAHALGDALRSWPVPFPSRDAAAKHLGDGPLARAWAADLERREDGLYPRFDPSVMEATALAMSVPRRQEWTRVEAPTLVVYADHGMFTSDQKSRFVDHLAHVTLVELDNASHDAHLDAFDQWSAALTAFLA